jgi:hypothetical protein
MDKPRLPISLTTPRGPAEAVWERMLGQFWIRVALHITDLPEGPKRESPPLLPADRHAKARPGDAGQG